MNKRTKKIVTASASVAFAGLLLLANPTITSAKEYSAEKWTPRTADEIKHDLDVLGEEGTTYTFQWGDTLSAVAQATDFSVDKLTALNGIHDANLIFVGNKLHLSKDQTVVTVQKEDELSSYDVSEETDEVTKVDTPIEVKETVENKKEEPKEEPKEEVVKNEESSEKIETSAIKGKTLIVEATAYSTNQPSLSDYTYTGINLRENPNVIAVDPNVIPLGSKVHVPGFGTFIAGDTGGAIKGNRIDIHITNLQSAIQFGRKKMEVTIIQ